MLTRRQMLQALSVGAATTAAGLVLPKVPLPPEPEPVRRWWQVPRVETVHKVIQELPGFELVGGRTVWSAQFPGPVTDVQRAQIVRYLEKQYGAGFGLVSLVETPKAPDPP